MDQLSRNDCALGKASGELLAAPRKAIVQSVITVPKAELHLPTDSLDALCRRVLIGINAYGLHDPRIVGFTGLDRQQIDKLIKTPEMKKLLDSGVTPCWTKAELISRLCVEAETASASKDRIAAITKLMEYRSIGQTDHVDFSQLIEGYSK